MAADMSCNGVMLASTALFIKEQLVEEDSKNSCMISVTWKLKSSFKSSREEDEQEVCILLLTITSLPKESVSRNSILSLRNIHNKCFVKKFWFQQKKY